MLKYLQGISYMLQEQPRHTHSMWAPLGPLVAPLGPLWAPMALSGRALVGLPGPFWAGLLWVPLGVVSRALVGLPGPLWAGP